MNAAEILIEVDLSECLNFFSSPTCALYVGKLKSGGSYLQPFIYTILSACNVSFLNPIKLSSSVLGG